MNNQIKPENQIKPRQFNVVPLTQKDLISSDEEFHQQKNSLSLKKCCLLQGCDQIENYKSLNKIHQGNYGVVFRGEEFSTGQKRAIKKLKLVQGHDFPITSIREISLLRTLIHPNIIKVFRVAISKCKSKVYIVMQYVEHQLKDLLLKISFNQYQVKRLMRDLLQGLKYLHSRNIIHRDLKTSNLLYSNSGCLKICDFGLARKLSSTGCELTQQVITMWYRPPELLLGASKYGTQVDMWSVGCIFAQLIIRTQLFKGTSEFDQLDLIFKTIGTPSQQAWPQFKSFKNYKFIAGKKSIGNKLRDMIPKGENGLSDQGIKLLSQFLIPNPSKRITAQKALKHQWFQEDPSYLLNKQMPNIPALNEIDRVKKKVKKDE